MKKKIFIIDDDVIFCKALTRWLKKSGYDVLASHDGESALPMAEEESPDLLLVDVLLPGMDGITLCTKMRQTYTLTHTPIIVMSAIYKGLDFKGQIDSFAECFLEKPFSKEHIIAKVREILPIDDELEAEMPEDQLPKNKLIVGEDTPNRPPSQEMGRLVLETSSGQELKPEPNDAVREKMTINPPQRHNEPLIVESSNGSNASVSQEQATKRKLILNTAKPESAMKPKVQPASKSKTEIPSPPPPPPPPPPTPPPEPANQQEEDDDDLLVLDYEMQHIETEPVPEPVPAPQEKRKDDIASILDKTDTKPELILSPEDIVKEAKPSAEDSDPNIDDIFIEFAETESEFSVELPFGAPSAPKIPEPSPAPPVTPKPASKSISKPAPKPSASTRTKSPDKMPPKPSSTISSQDTKKAKFKSDKAILAELDDLFKITKK